MSKVNHLFKILRRGKPRLEKQLDKQGKLALVLFDPVTIANPFYGIKLSSFAHIPSMDFASVGAARRFVEKEKRRIQTLAQIAANPIAMGLNDSKAGKAMLRDNLMPVHYSQSKGGIKKSKATAGIESRFSIRDNSSGFNNTQKAELKARIAKIKRPEILHIPYALSIEEKKDIKEN
jgi:hypothetical protein